MRYDVDELLHKAYKNETKEKPSDALNRELIESMKECCGMDKRKTKGLKMFGKFATVCCAVIAITGISVYGFSEIKARVWKSSVKFENGDEVEIASNVSCKKIPNEALISEKCVELTLQEVEEMLGFHLLDNDSEQNKTVAYSTYENEDGSLGMVQIWRGNWRSGENGGVINMNITILNEGADKGYVISFEEGIDAMGGKELIGEFFSERLSTSIILYSAGTIDGEGGVLTATFEYDSVLYEVSGDGVTEEEILEIIESLH